VHFKSDKGDLHALNEDGMLVGCRSESSRVARGPKIGDMSRTKCATCHPPPAEQGRRPTARWSTP